MTVRPTLAIVGPLPTLDQVVEHPELTGDLPQQALHELALKALAVQHICALALIAAPPAPAAATDPAQLVDADDVAQRLGLSRREVYRQAKAFPFSTFVVRPTSARVVRFRLALVEEYARDPDAYRRRHAGARKAG